MNYHFNYKNKPLDFWQLSMYFTYGSIVGVCNAIFTVAMILLTIKMWVDATSFVRMLLLFAIILFPIIQPIGIYTRAQRQAATASDIDITFDDTGVHVQSGETNSDIEWKNIKRVSKKPNMIVVFSTTTHGFILTNKVIGKNNKEFYNYISSKMEQKN